MNDVMRDRIDMIASEMRTIEMLLDRAGVPVRDSDTNEVMSLVDRVDWLVQNRQA